MKVRIYVEGGGNRKDLRADCQKAFQKLFLTAGLKDRLPRVIPCGSRQNTYDDFCTALKNCAADELPMMLVDSEDQVKPGNGPWAHLRARVGDGWQQPPDALDDHAHLMVQCMETWFLAERANLEKFFGQGFLAGSLPQGNKLEEIPKQHILDGLEKATRQCKTKVGYSKGKHSFELLANLDAKIISASCPHAKRLMDHLNRVCG